MLSVRCSKKVLQCWFQNGSPETLFEPELDGPDFTTDDAERIPDVRSSPDLIRGASKPDETDSMSNSSEYSDPRFPEPKPSVFKKPELKPDLVRFSEPLLSETDEAPEPEQSGIPEQKEIWHDKEIRKVENSDRSKLDENSVPKEEEYTLFPGMESTSIPIFEVFVFLLILLTIIGAIFTVWTNLHIFMPVLIFAYAVIKFRERA